MGGNDRDALNPEMLLVGHSLQELVQTGPAPGAPESSLVTLQQQLEKLAVALGPGQ
jgi:hypothetical protein